MEHKNVLFQKGSIWIWKVGLECWTEPEVAMNGPRGQISPLCPIGSVYIQYERSEFELKIRKGRKVHSGGCKVRGCENKYLCMGINMLGYVLDEFQRPKLLSKVSFYKLGVHSYMGRKDPIN